MKIKLPFVIAPESLKDIETRKFSKDEIVDIWKIGNLRWISLDELRDIEKDENPIHKH